MHPQKRLSGAAFSKTLPRPFYFDPKQPRRVRARISPLRRIFRLQINRFPPFHTVCGVVDDGLKFTLQQITQFLTLMGKKMRGQLLVGLDLQQIGFRFTLKIQRRELPALDAAPGQVREIHRCQRSQCPWCIVPYFADSAKLHYVLQRAPVGRSFSKA